jgi:hypothetical protein
MSIVIDKILAASPSTERGRPTQLSSDPKGERIAYAVSVPGWQPLEYLLIRPFSQANLSFFDPSTNPLSANNTLTTQPRLRWHASPPPDST